MKYCVNPQTKKSARLGFVSYPCGKCIPCLERKILDWDTRIRVELNGCKKNKYFLTLTYNEINVPYKKCKNGEIYRNLDKEQFKSYINRVKQHLKFKYFACGEYGDHGDRPHYHMIVWDLEHIRDKNNQRDISKEYYHELFFRYWKNTKTKQFLGDIQLEQLKVNSPTYLLKYLLKQQINEKAELENPFYLNSNRISYNHCMAFKHWYRRYLQSSGGDWPLPRLFRFRPRVALFPA